MEHRSGDTTATSTIDRRSSDPEALSATNSTFEGPAHGVATIDFSLKPLRDDEGNVSIMLAEGHDITERIRADTS